MLVLSCDLAFIIKPHSTFSYELLVNEDVTVSFTLFFFCK